MKKLVSILMFLIVSSINSQNLITPHLIEVLNTPNYATIEAYIKPFGFVFKKSENNIVAYVRESRNFNEIETLEIDVSNGKKKVIYAVHGADKFKNLKKNIIANGFEYLQTLGPLEYYVKIAPSSTLSLSIGTLDDDYTYHVILNKVD